MWVNKKNILLYCCELAICKLKKCMCISCGVPINDCYLQQHQFFFQISRLVLNVTSSCLQPHYADRLFFFQSQLIPVCCISVFSPSFVCLAWRHGNCFICDDSSLPRSSSSNLLQMFYILEIQYLQVYMSFKKSLFLHLNPRLTKAAIPNTSSY